MGRASKASTTARSQRGNLRRRIAVGLLLVGAIMIAGLCGGTGLMPFDAAARAQQPKVNDKQKSGGIDLTYFDDEARIMLAIRPIELLQSPEIKAAVEEKFRDFRFFSLLVANRIEQVTLMGGEPSVAPPFVVLQFSKPVTVEELIETEMLPADAARITAESVVDAMPFQSGYGVLNDRTYVIGSAKSLVAYLGKRDGGEPAVPSGDAWEKVRKGALVAAMDMELLRAQLRLPGKSTPEDAAPHPLSEIAPLWTDSEYVAAGIMIEGKTAHVRAVATCPDGASAENVADAAAAGKTLAQNLLRTAKENERGVADFAKVGMNIAEDLVKEVKIERAEELVIVQASAELSKVGKAAASSVLEALSQSRNAARQTQSVNNARQIMLAMHNWASANKLPGVPDAIGIRFPPPVIMGQDGTGKVPHSWRVELLPFLGHEELYRQYNFDEPWDSETNKRVLEKMPDVFRHPTDDPTSTKSAYYVLTGLELLEDMAVPGGFPTAFSAKNGMSMAQIVDGTSNTIAIVEAKADIPWTKPDDIPFDPKKHPPMLGGFFKDIFYVGFCDGAVRALKYDLDPDVLKLMVTPDEGIPVPD